MWAALAAMVAIASVAAIVLGSFEQPAAERYATSNTRVD
jgi:hypothetical protein